VAKEWTDDEIKAEIKRCHDIVREDRERASYTSLHEKYGKPAYEGQTEVEGGPPPRKDPPEKSEPKKKRSIWFGEIDD
jgi:hypothetical protein